MIDTQAKIMIVQIILCFVIHMAMYPDFGLVGRLEKIFGSYSRALLIITGGQLLLIIINFISLIIKI